MYITIVKSCQMCGEEMAYQVFDKFPTIDQIKNLKKSIGGMDCIRHFSGPLSREPIEFEMI